MSATSPGVTLGGTNLAGGYSPETFLQMSKKIAQMTQVIYSLNNKIEVQDSALHAMKEHYENSLKECIHDASNRTKKKSDDELRIRSHVHMLEKSLRSERERNELLLKEYKNLREQMSSRWPDQRLTSLFQELRETKTDFERKLDEFEHLHHEMTLSPTSTATPTLERNASAGGNAAFRLTEQVLAAYMQQKSNEFPNNLKPPLSDEIQMALKSNTCSSVPELIARFSTQGTSLDETLDSEFTEEPIIVKHKEINVVRNNLQQMAVWSLKKLRTLKSKYFGNGTQRESKASELVKLKDKISMLEATKTEQEIVINKLQTEVVKLKEKVRHLCKLRQDLLEQRSQVEDRMRSVQREREHEINQRDSKIRELEDELEQYECKMEYLEHTQVHLQRSLLASENKTPKLLEELQKISQDLAECRDELKEKNHRIHELANSVMTKEAMIERLQGDLKAFKKEAAAEMEKRFLNYTEEKERLMSQLQEETEEYVKAAFAEKDCQLKELNEEWQVRYDQLNDEMTSLRKELDEAIAEKNDLLLSREDSSSSEDEQSVSDASESTSSDSELDWQVQERIERFREELTRIHDINTIEQRTKHESQLSEVRDKLEQKIMILKKQHEEELREFDQLLNDELNRVHKKYQTEIRRLRDQKSGSRELDDPTGRRKSDKGVQAFVGHSVDRFGNSTEVPEEIQAMKMRLSEVRDELKQKQDEIVTLRTEASNQIRNVELYWQERLTTEMKELCYIKEREVESLRDEWNKQVKQLTDKINSLQTIMKLTGQDQPVVTPIVEEPSTSEERDEDDAEVDEDTDEDVESIEEVDGGQSDEEFEEIIEEIIELSPCAQRAAALKHNPLTKSPSASLEASSTMSSFPRSLLKKSSSSGDCRLPNRGKRVSFAEDRGDLPMLLRYNPDVSCMDILRPLEEQFLSKKKRSSIIRQSMKRSQTKEEPMDSQQTQF